MSTCVQLYKIKNKKQKTKNMGNHASSSSSNIGKHELGTSLLSPYWEKSEYNIIQEFRDLPLDFSLCIEWTKRNFHECAARRALVEYLLSQNGHILKQKYHRKNKSMITFFFVSYNKESKLRHSHHISFFRR